MNSLIDQLLLYKNEKYNEGEKKLIDKRKVDEYLDSCIVFIYDRNNFETNNFLNLIKQFDVQYLKDNEINKDVKAIQNALFQKEIKYSYYNI